MYQSEVMALSRERYGSREQTVSDAGRVDMGGVEASRPTAAKIVVFSADVGLISLATRALPYGWELERCSEASNARNSLLTAGIRLVIVDDEEIDEKHPEACEERVPNGLHELFG